MKIVFFRRPKPRHFRYTPVYWDEEKEKLNERKKRIEKAGKEKTHEDIKEDLRFQIDRKWRKYQDTTKQKTHFTRFLVYLFILVFFVYFIFFTNFVNNFISFFIK